MSFWTGFFAGIAATYAVSLIVMGFLFWQRKSGHAPVQPAENEQLDFSAEYPSVSFTHLTSIGTAVRGYDD